MTPLKEKGECCKNLKDIERKHGHEVVKHTYNKTILIICLLTILNGFFAAVSCTMYFMTCNSNPEFFTEPNNSVNAFRVIPRNEWIAMPPRSQLTSQDAPADKVIISHSTTENCNSMAECLFRLRFIQTFHMEARNWDDIAYNFLIGGDGNAYEGRGWDKIGAHSKGYNKGSIGIAFVGTFTKQAPPEKQLKTAQLLIDEGVRLGKLAPDYKLFGSRQLFPTESPGQALYTIIQTWPHWSNNL